MEFEDVYANVGSIYNRVLNEVNKVVVGQREVVEQTLIAILTDNHALLEGYPGLAKTLLVSTIAQIMDLKFQRIQCTPDIVPSDITGTYIVEETADGRKEFRFEKGPVFANIVLADEINRATPKSQSALLEAMQERQVTLGNATYPLKRPFFVLATQNPIEMEGTYPLPEAQLDRFLLKILVGYPSADEEAVIVDRYVGETTPSVNKVIDKETLTALQKLTRKMPVANDIRDLALRIVSSTRKENGGEIATQYIEYGASPRASIGMVLAAKASALIHGRNYVSREDILAMAYPILRHRIILNFEAERQGVSTDDVIREIARKV
ncbi:MAG: AAA family ATPase [Candidatus Altiarchaeales archaeon WOR_SM1_86-2]|nr:MAG: AAA family ATPase [Candidatus Altiarchaeales archaeon WOR_SM1_86-2]